MTLDPDHGFGLLSPEDQEKMELILTERSDGSYGGRRQWIGYCKRY
jgi:hypothetical protein